MEKIRFEYKDQLSNFEVVKASKMWILNFEQDLQKIIEDLKQNHQNPEITKLLLNYEITFTRILSILNESKKIEKDMFDELLLLSKESIDYFIEEVQKEKNVENELLKETKETTRKRFIEELKLDLDFQKKRNTIF